jgi:uncharacterized protein (TIGR03085 family)
MSIAEAERRAISDLFDDLGPDAPTLCTGWLARDLAAHLVLRERRPDASPGILIKPLAGYTERVQHRIGTRPWAELVDLVRSGPPGWSPWAIPAVANLINTVEYFVHHEDLRRGAPDWAPRPPDAARDAALWRSLARVGRLTYRRSPVGVVLRRPDGAEITPKSGPNPVVVSGETGELVLHAVGRDAARVSVEGPEESVRSLAGMRRGL